MTKRATVPATGRGCCSGDGGPALKTMQVTRQQRARLTLRERGWTQRRMCEAIGCSQSTVSEALSDRPDPTYRPATLASVLADIERALGLED